MNSQYEVLTPWAEADTVPLRGISPRLPELKDKTIGLFFNNKRAARPIQDVVEKKLREKFVNIEFRRFERVPNVSVAETEDKARFDEWVKGVDAVITAVGD